MAEINWTVEAEIWLTDIFDHISEDDRSAAKRVIEDIIDRVDVLRDFPRAGHRYEALADREIRTLQYGHYRIAYLIKSDQAIDIIGVFHDALDIGRYLL